MNRNGYSFIVIAFYKNVASLTCDEKKLRDYLAVTKNIRNFAPVLWAHARRAPLPSEVIEQ